MAETPAPAELELNLEGVRARIRSELLDVVELDLVDSGIDLTGAVRNLVEAYVRLGGDLELPPPTPPARINPADLELRERVRAAAWKAANVHTSTDNADHIAELVVAALDEAAR